MAPNSEKMTSGDLLPDKEDAEKLRAWPSAGPRASGQTVGEPATGVTRGEQGLIALLGAEKRLRSAGSEDELHHLIVNELRRLVAARQVVLVRTTARGGARVAAVSSVAVVDRDTPFIRWIEALIGKLSHTQGLQGNVDFELQAFADTGATETQSYPFKQILWQPLKLRSGEVFAGLLLAREKPWTDADKHVVAHQSEFAAVVWQSLRPSHKLRPRKSFSKYAWFAVGAVSVAASLLPVPMTTLAPVEIVAAAPQWATSPIDGVIKSVPVDPNQRVKAGQVILRFDDTVLQNRLKVAERDTRVAQSRYDRALQASFSDEKARHSLAIALNEYRLKQAERDFAASQLAKTVITAKIDGVLVYADKDQLIGRPVKTGERLMHIADPKRIAARIDLPVRDAIVLETGADARLFMDANPLASLAAKITRKGYHAEVNSTQQLVYKLYADVSTSGSAIRIGARGTAQLYGEPVPLIYFLLRRPISAVRQYVGL